MAREAKTHITFPVMPVMEGVMTITTSVMAVISYILVVPEEIITFVKVVPPFTSKHKNSPKDLSH